MKNADLHTHSYFSDGELSPTQLVQLAKKRRLKYFALTDHNSVKGVREAIRAGKKYSVNVIPAVEVVCEEGEVLAYFIDVNYLPLVNLMKKTSAKIELKVKHTLAQFQALGYDIKFSDFVKKNPNARGNYNEAFYMQWFVENLKLKSWKEAIRFIQSFKFKKKKVRCPSVLKVIKLVRKAGGVPVLAHPWFADESILKRITHYKKAGLAGLEINNGDRSPLKSVKMVKLLKLLAKKHNLVLTSGSDFHGPSIVKFMPGNHDLGRNNCDERVVDFLNSKV